MRAFLFWGLIWAQKSYFQQRVEYQIRVRLDPTRHELHGFLRLTYHNRSPDTLYGLYFHLWPNAYRDRRTAFAKQMRATYKRDFLYARPQERGWIDSLAFRVEGEPVRPLPAAQGPKPASGYSLELLRYAPDVVWVPLPKPLAPGHQTIIETPFRVRVPLCFSRMGRDQVQYQITQWYPKPAVYDAKGWHPLPYLDQGEFYSEWGRYEVEIEVPENFVVGATGVLQNEEERAWLRQREIETRTWLSQLPEGLTSRESKEFPPLPPWSRDGLPASSYKKLVFIQDSVHDFAWFADPRYEVLSDTITLPQGNRVACVALFRLEYGSVWRYAPQYIAEALQKLTSWVGAYPYAHATAVEGALQAGGGMEYPMITVISAGEDTSTLREVIVHEVGHNWFQGMLASNERLHPWLDEGMNTYYEQRMITGEERVSMELGFRSGGLQRRLGLGQADLNIVEAALHHLGLMQSLSLSAEKYSSVNYGLSVYQRTGSWLRWLSRQVSLSAWDEGMQHYYQQWAFRHPYPENWARAAEEKGIPGRAFLSVLYEEQPPNFRLRWRRLSDSLYEVRAELRKGNPAWRAFRLSAHAEGPYGKQEYLFRVDSASSVTLPAGTRRFVLNPEQLPFERKVSDNSFRPKGLFSGWRGIDWRILPLSYTGVERVGIGTLPAIGYNHRDGLMVGAFLNYGLFPKRTLEWHLLPLYSLPRREMRGSIGTTLRAFPTGKVQLVEGRVRSAYFAGFWHTRVSIDLTLRKRYEVLSWRHVFRVRGYHLAFAEEGGYRFRHIKAPAYAAIDWEARREELLWHIYGKASVGYAAGGTLRSEVEGEVLWRPLKRWYLWLRGYGGWVSENAPDYLLFRATGFDPFGEMVLLDRFRESASRLWRQQIPQTQGGWRAPVDTLKGSTLLAVNVEFPLRLFTLRGDMGYLSSANQSYWGISVGLPVVKIRGRTVFAGYFPIAGSLYQGGRPRRFSEVWRGYTWTLAVPLDLRWAIPW
ncbi:MAG: M1 family metallopeptidase [Bacteroidia bacterium]|nr:M1 family metallopeptidase [Bacteroidia bacterium]